MHWVSNIMIIGASIKNSSPVICLKLGFTPEDVLKAIHKYKPHKWMSSLAILRDICNMPNVKELLNVYDMSSLEFVIVGGSHTPADVKKKILTGLFGNRVWLTNCYGCTECGCVTDDDERVHTDPEKFDSIGVLGPGNVGKVVDLVTGKTLGPGQEGELYVKTAAMMGGMLGLKGEDYPIDGEGWFHTGDLVKYDKDGFLYYVSRLKDIMEYRGSRIVPAEMENVINQHPDVIESSVVGVPNSADGDWPTAYVVLKQGSNLTEQELVDFATARLSPNKTLRGGVHFIDSIPKSSVGKVLKRELIRLAMGESKLVTGQTFT